MRLFIPICFHTIRSPTLATRVDQMKSVHSSPFQMYPPSRNRRTSYRGRKLKRKEGYDYVRCRIDECLKRTRCSLKKFENFLNSTVWWIKQMKVGSYGLEDILLSGRTFQKKFRLIVKET
jgi:hypothetical protein